MTTIRKILTCSLLMTLVSCSNEFEWDNYYDSHIHTWQENLDNWVSMYGKQLENSEMKIVGMERMETVSCFSDINDTTGYSFPVYCESYERFDPVTLRFIENDTITTHVSLEALRARLDYITRHEDDFYFVKLNWLCSNVFEISTIAVFLKEDNTLYYDNLLTNLIDPVLMKNRRALITKSEIVNGGISNEDLEYAETHRVEYGNRGSYVNLQVSVFGKWQRSIYVDDHNNPTKYYLDWFPTYVSDNHLSNCYDYTIDGNSYFSNRCAKNLLEYKYLIWVGPCNSSYSSSNFYNTSDYYYDKSDEDGEIKADLVSLTKGPVILLY